METEAPMVVQERWWCWGGGGWMGMVWSTPDWFPLSSLCWQSPRANMLRGGNCITLSAYWLAWRARMFRSKNLNIHVCVKTLVIISLQLVSLDTTFASIKIMMICHKSTHSQHTKHVLSGCKLEEKERKIKNYQEKGRKCGMLAHMQAMFCVWRCCTLHSVFYLLEVATF